MDAEKERSKRTRIILIILAILFVLILLINIVSNSGEVEQESMIGVPTIIDLGSDCYTCTQQKGYLDTLKEKYTDEVNIKKIDIYENPSEAEKYDVKLIPTLIFIDKDGKQVYRHEGLLNYDELEQKLFDLGLFTGSCNESEGC